MDSEEYEDDHQYSSSELENIQDVTKLNLVPLAINDDKTAVQRPTKLANIGQVLISNAQTIKKTLYPKLLGETLISCDLS
jgi:hypothetical protein